MKIRRKITIVQTTVSSMKEAQRLAALVLGKRRGACIQLIPIKSHYRWRGKTESAEEILLLIKTRPDLAGKLAALIRKNHPYELPEIMITSAEADSRYAEWIKRETK